MPSVKTLVAYVACLATATLFVTGVHLVKAHARSPTAQKEQSTLPDSLAQAHEPRPANGDEPPLLRQPPGMQGQAFGFEYPSMHAAPWPGEIELLNLRQHPGYVPQPERFLVYLTWLDYQPWDLDHLPRHLIPRRPWQILRDRSPDDERAPSPFAGLDFLFNSRLDPNGRQTAVAHPENALYIGTRGSPYELLVRCDKIECNADVYSERSRFEFRLEFSSDGLAHTSDLIAATDRMIASWAPPDSEIARHWRDPASNHAAPIEEELHLPDCDGSGYTRRSLPTSVSHPTFVATNKSGDVFLTSSEFPSPNKLYRLPADQGVASAPQAQLLAKDIGMVSSLTTDAAGVVYATRSPGHLMRLDPDSRFFNNFSDVTSLPGDQVTTLRLAPNGDAVYIDFQVGSVHRRTGAGTGSTRDTVIATDFDLPAGLAISPSGAVYVLDEERRLIKRLDTDGGIHMVPVKLRRPSALTVDTHGNIFVVDNSVAPIKRISSTGDVCAVTHELRPFSYDDIAVDPKGRIFATDLVDNVLDEFVPGNQH